MLNKVYNRKMMSLSNCVKGGLISSKQIKAKYNKV